MKKKTVYSGVREFPKPKGPPPPTPQPKRGAITGNLALEFWEKWYTSGFLEKEEHLKPIAKRLVELIGDKKILEEKLGKESFTLMIAGILNGYFEDLADYLENFKA